MDQGTVDAISRILNRNTRVIGVHLREEHGMKYTEIAKRLDLTYGTVRDWFPK